MNLAEAGSETRWFGHPAALSTLFFTEMWERFSYYGMRAILMFFMVAPLEAGGLGFGLKKAGLIYGTYTMCVYLLAIPGGFIADNFFGARRTVLAAGIVIALGHFALALPSQRSFYLGLAMVAVGSGLLKPNMSTMVGGLYPAEDLRRDAGFSLFYLGINLGAFGAPLVTGYLAQSRQWKDRLAALGFNPIHSWHWGFAAAGVGMTLGLIVYLFRGRSIAQLGRPPPPDRSRPWGKLAWVMGAVGAFLLYAFKSDQPGWEWMRSAFVIAPVAAVLCFGFRERLDSKRIAAVLVFFLAAMVFWTIFEQAGTTIALFSDRLTRADIFGRAFPSAWFQSLNSLFVILLAPAFAWLWIRLGARQPSSPIKFVFGLGLLGLSFLLMVPAARLTSEGRVSPLWLVGLFFLQTLGELCLSQVGLSTMTKLAPPKLAGLVMGIWFLADAFGNKLAGVLAGRFQGADPHALALFFFRQAVVAGASALFLLALSPWLKRLMGGVR
jgi:proton-dependent oligopeptide transporter, POT family